MLEAYTEDERDPQQCGQRRNEPSALDLREQRGRKPGVLPEFNQPRPFTVFAPTDEAFAKLPAGTVENLLKPENRDKLRSILTYHVVAGKVTAADVMKMKSGKTVQGSSVKIAVSGGKVMVDNATVAKADVMASNGVIHVIDTVLMPK